ncbi:protein O6 [Cercopithecine betaherpesvirus 5]|uniref:Protein O6 n=1 Tax=Simian cytomegalovirus (strain Colburn) TaxID=50292 RepID=G8XTQ4_SCMVC|nr:protein O6 [Cercopithecine betaherpesvirus 5]
MKMDVYNIIFVTAHLTAFFLGIVTLILEILYVILYCQELLHCCYCKCCYRHDGSQVPCDSDLIVMTVDPPPSLLNVQARC